MYSRLVKMIKILFEALRTVANKRVNFHVKVVECGLFLTCFLIFLICSQGGRWRRRYNLRGFRSSKVERRNRSLTVFRRHRDTHRSSDFDATMPHARRKLHNFANDANSSYVAATNLNELLVFNDVTVCCCAIVATLERKVSITVSHRSGIF